MQILEYSHSTNRK